MGPTWIVLEDSYYRLLLFLSLPLRRNRDYEMSMISTVCGCGGVWGVCVCIDNKNVILAKLLNCSGMDFHGTVANRYLGKGTPVTLTKMGSFLVKHTMFSILSKYKKCLANPNSYFSTSKSKSNRYLASTATRKLIIFLVKRKEKKTAIILSLSWANQIILFHPGSSLIKFSEETCPSKMINWFFKPDTGMGCDVKMWTL